MIYLDTGPVIWLSGHVFTEISQAALDLIEASDNLFVCPMIELELQYLYEIERLTHKPDFILNYLSKKIGLEVCVKPLSKVIEYALKFNWTRDPFDRIIAANAAIDDNVLITRDKAIRKNYKHSVW